MNSEIFSIITTTFCMAFMSTAISSCLGIIFGIMLAKAKFPGKKIVVRLCRTFIGMPPVVIGLIVFLLLMRNGPLGFLGWIFTIQGMVFAQVLLITPIVTGIIYTAASRMGPEIRAFAKTMGANKYQTLFLMMKEMRQEIYFAVIAGFGRAISEVGAVLIVGGNIQNKTRTMTTTIAMMRNMGNFTQAITLGIILIIIAFLLQTLSDIFCKEREEENF